MTTLVPNATRFEPAERQALLLTMIRAGSNDLRERALRIGAETLPEEALVDLLREEADDVVRNAALEMLKLRGRRSFAIGVRLLADADPDVVLQAVLLLDCIGDPRAWAHLHPLLRHPDENIVQAAIIAAGHLGSRGTAGDILPFLESSLWMQMAALSTLGQLRSRIAVTPVARLLDEPDLHDLAAETLARIGGPAAARALAEHWKTNEATLDPEQWLPLLAQALADSEVLSRAPLLRQRLLEYVNADRPAVATAAAAAILALGPGEGDGQALDVLVSALGESSHLPPCLARRGDLAEWLITIAPHNVRDWGYELFLRDPLTVPVETLRRAVVQQPPAGAAIFSEIATRFADVPTLISIFTHWPALRDAIAPLLRRKRHEVLLECGGQAAALGDTLLLLDAAGAPSNQVVEGIVKLNPDDRLKVIAQLRGRRTIAALPWARWIEDDRARFAPLLGDVVSRRHVLELLPLVRRELAVEPLPELVACAGALRDRNSAGAVVSALSRCAPAMRATVFNSIAAIGGKNARQTLLQFVAGTDRADARLAARALCSHAAESDGEMLRELAAHPDWSVRYSAADALGRSPDAENIAVLKHLAADASPVVAQRARAGLDAGGIL